MSDSVSLDRLAPGEVGRVLSLDSEGPERRRLMDLGIVPGVQVRAALRSPLGDPTAYEVRGALIALRREQAARITVKLLEASSDA